MGSRACGPTSRTPTAPRPRAARAALAALAGLLASVLGVTACGGDGPPPRAPAERAADSAPAVDALVAGRFEEAATAASSALARDPRNATAAAVRAIARYQGAGAALLAGLERVLEEADDLRALDHEAGRLAWQRFVERLDAIDADLAVAAADPGLALELCPACWEHDWNRSGEVDDRDRRLFEIEVDRAGDELPEGDPRRRPTFRLDVGDAHWARAMVAFQRAAVELILAYRWTELDRLGRERRPRLVIRLAEPARVRRARALILAGLDHADRCRAAYLAETDDDREWVPSPRQRSYAVPLPVDAALYETWAAITGDVRRLIRGDEGLSLRELAALVDDELAAMVPDAYVDVGRLLGAPADLVLDLGGRGDDRSQVERVLRGLLGKAYAARMKRSPLPGRLRAMKAELERGEDTAGRKLRYLLWLN
ncbi:MAG: hypothetical protein KJZ91_28705 [Myxococcales bacterium]|nr:hypothetical protein [Myxococcales bacterium]